MASLFKNGFLTSGGIAAWNRMGPFIHALYTPFVKAGVDPAEVTRLIQQCCRDAELISWGHRDKVKPPPPPVPPEWEI